MMNVMIPRSPHPQPPKRLIPNERILRMNQRQPISVQTPESHVTPNITRHAPRRNKKGDQNHNNRIGSAAVKRVKKSRVRELVVRFVAETVEFGRDAVFEPVHGVLDAVLDDEGEEDVEVVDASRKGVVGRGYEAG